MAPKLYFTDTSPACRSTLMLAKAINLPVEIIPINLVEKEQLKPEYLKINPQHTVPTLDDDGFIIWESHAINVYLMEKYAGNKSLYPDDIKKRAIINNRLSFDNGVLFPELLTTVRPLIRFGATTVPKEKIEIISNAYNFLESFIGGNEYVAGKELSIADFSLVTTITTLDFIVPITQEKFPNIKQWISRMESLPYYSEANEPGLTIIRTLIKAQLAKA